MPGGDYKDVSHRDGGMEYRLGGEEAEQHFGGRDLDPKLVPGPGLSVVQHGRKPNALDCVSRRRLPGVDNLGNSPKALTECVRPLPDPGGAIVRSGCG